MSSTYQLTLSRETVKFLKKQEKSVQLRISNALKGLLIQPPIGDIKPLKGKKGLLRLKIGPYRTIFEIDHDEKIVYILTIDNRGDVYK